MHPPKAMIKIRIVGKAHIGGAIGDGLQRKLGVGEEFIDPNAP